MANEHATNRQAALDAIDEMRKAYVKVRDDRDSYKTALCCIEILAINSECKHEDLTRAYRLAVNAVEKQPDQEPHCDCYPSPENWGVCRDCGKDLGDSGAVSPTQTDGGET